MASSPSDRRCSAFAQLGWAQAPTARAQQRGCLVVGVTEPTSRPGRQRSLRYTPKAGRKNSSGQVRNDGRGQVESNLGRTRLTSDAPYKAMLWLRMGFGFAGAWTVREQNRLLALCFGLKLGPPRPILRPTLEFATCVDAP